MAEPKLNDDNGHFVYLSQAKPLNRPNYKAQTLKKEKYQIDYQIKKTTARTCKLLIFTHLHPKRNAAARSDMERAGPSVSPKRSKVLRHIGKLKTGVALLQETHLSEGHFFRLRKWWVSEVLGSPAKGKIGGVVTLLKKNLPYTVGKTEADTEGHKLTATLTPKGTNYSSDITITNLYAPNTQHKQFYHDFTDWYLANPIPHHMIGGDFNLTVSEAEDRKQLRTRTQNTPPKNCHQHIQQTSVLEEFLTHIYLIDT